MPEQDLNLDDFMEQAAGFLAARRTQHGDNIFMLADDDKDDDEIDLDDPDGQDDPDDQDDQDDSDDDQDDEDSKPATKEDGSPVTQKDFTALNEALKKERKEHRALKRAKGKAGADGEPDEAMLEKATEAAEAKFKPLLVNQAAKAAFVSAGLKLPEGREDSVMKRVLKQLDMEDLELDEDGEVDGLDDQIADIKADFPELFEAPKRRRTGRQIDGAERGKGAGQDEDSASLLTKQMRGGR